MLIALFQHSHNGVAAYEVLLARQAGACTSPIETALYEQFPRLVHERLSAILTQPSTNLCPLALLMNYQNIRKSVKVELADSDVPNAPFATSVERYYWLYYLHFRLVSCQDLASITNHEVYTDSLIVRETVILQPFSPGKDLPERSICPSLLRLW